MYLPAGLVTDARFMPTKAPPGTRCTPTSSMQRINHQKGYSIDGACTNGAESYFSRLRRGEFGHHHHISGRYLVRYAQEAAWREDLRRVSNGEQVYGVVGLAMRVPTRRSTFCGYWQRARAA